MHSSFRRMLQSSPPQTEFTVDSDVVVILTSLLCALISVLGLALVARCACIRLARMPSSSPSLPVMNKGINKKVLQSIPKISFDTAADKLSCCDSGDCAICLAEFEDGDQIRILPQCGHGFHAECVDKWLVSHPSCPSCRQVLVVPALTACKKCATMAAEVAAVDLP